MIQNTNHTTYKIDESVIQQKTNYTPNRPRLASNKVICLQHARIAKIDDTEIKQHFSLFPSG